MGEFFFTKRKIKPFSSFILVYLIYIQKFKVKGLQIKTKDIYIYTLLKLLTSLYVPYIYMDSFIFVSLKTRRSGLFEYIEEDSLKIACLK